MARQFGSKNKPKQLTEAGNATFNINSVEPSQTLNAPAAAAITDEDLAFDRELDMIARNAEPTVSDIAPPELKKSNEQYTLLSEYVDDYKPASTIHELDNQIFDAVSYGADSILATERIVKHFCKNAYPDKVGYFIYKNIKVYIEGFFEQSVKRDKESVDFRNFGASKVV